MNWLTDATNRLSRARIGTARLDALILLEDVSNKKRSWLLAHPEFELSSQQIDKLDKLVAKRAQHEPLAYIRSQTEFYGRTFAVTPSVLEPRPESETMVELALELLDSYSKTSNNITFVDVGTGSGALAITLKLEAPQTNILATDIDENCLKIARKNAKTLAANVKFLQGDLLVPIKNVQLTNYNLLANLPYVPDGFTINPAAMREPRLAIFGGPDGLDIYRKLFSQIDHLKTKPSYILAEALPPQHDTLTNIAGQSGYKLIKSNDFIGLFQAQQVAK